MHPEGPSTARGASGTQQDGAVTPGPAARGAAVPCWDQTGNITQHRDAEGWYLVSDRFSTPEALEPKG